MEQPTTEELLMAHRDDELGSPNEGRDRDKYRDNDDMRDPNTSDQRSDTKPDTKTEARGDARETVGRNARGTDANPTGPEGNDRTRQRDD
jgi:hypothetical protein